MKIPKKLKIGGFIYRVERDINVADHSNSFGTTVNGKQVINVTNDVPLQKQEQTLIHEILHAIWFVYGLKEAGFKPDQQENIVDALSQGLYQVLKDNHLLK